MGRVGINVGQVGLNVGELVGASWHRFGASWFWGESLAPPEGSQILCGYDDFPRQKFLHFHLFFNLRYIFHHLKSEFASHYMHLSNVYFAGNFAEQTTS